MRQDRVLPPSRFTLRLSRVVRLLREGPLELFRRITARETGTFLGRLKTGELTLEQASELAVKAASAVLQLTLADATQVFAEPAWIREIAEIVRGDANHLLIVVDSVHSWAEMSNAEATEYESLNVALTSLQKLAALLKCPILVVAERNRASMSKGGLNAAAGSRRFEYVAETVLDLTRDKDDNQEGSDEVLVTLCFAKNRNGAAGRKVDLKFHGARQLFREV